MANGKETYKELVFAMGRTGILGYGGGPSVIPLIRYEAITRYRWLDDDEFGDTLALANVFQVLSPLRWRHTLDLS